MASEALSGPPPLESSRAALQLLIFRLTAQQDAWVRMKTRATGLAGLSLALAGIYVGILNASAEPPGVLEWVGVAIIVGALLVTGMLFLWVIWPSQVRGAPDPQDINEGAWVGEQAIWMWSHTLQDAFDENRAHVDRSFRINAAMLAFVSLQGVAFLVFTISAIASR